MNILSAKQPSGYWQSEVQRWRDGTISNVTDQVAEEVPVALVYSGIPYVVMLCTPQDLEDFAIGFSLSERIIDDYSEVKSVEVYPVEHGIEVHVCIPSERFVALADKQRNLTGRTGCGLCGTSTLEQAVRRPPAVSEGLRITGQALHQAFLELHSRQSLNAVTGAVHAAAWALPNKGVQMVREDVGRHNALDKLLGALARGHIESREGYILVTSRASYEMVQKTATLGVSLMAAISAPTGLAIRLAQDVGLTLIGFARNESHVIYTHPERLIV